MNRFSLVYLVKFFIVAIVLLFSSPKANGSSGSFKNRNEPWLVEEAIKFLEEFFQENPNAIVLEFGSGASTLWIAKRTSNLYSVEHSKVFYDQILDKLRSEECVDANYILSPCPYYSICQEFPDEYFDLIIVDGRNRKGCILSAIPKLKEGGILMLDNSERVYYHSTFDLMAGWEHSSAEQLGPDKFGYWYSGWKTDWWKKPIQHLR